MFFLDWISTIVKRAVLRGFEQAAQELALDTAPGDDADPLALLKSRMTPALTDASNGESKPSRRKK
jgi:hypothetical protein